jgi:hypothetical protein
MPYSKVVQEVFDEDEYEDASEQESIYEDPTPSTKNIRDISLNIPGVTIFYGMTCSGKSVLMKHLLYQHYTQFHQIFVFQGCKTPDWDCMDKSHVYLINENCENMLQIIIDSTKSLVKKNQHTLIILDDPFNGETKFHQSKIWNKISTMSRHALISIWMSVQHPGLIPPVLKSNMAGYFITKVTESNLSKIHEYALGFKNKALFIDYVSSNINNKGKVFYNDIRDVYNTKPYSIVTVPYPPPRFKIKMA